jgi:hypothetical protein
MTTQIIRIKIEGNLNTAIQNECDVRGAVGFRLAGCFTQGAELVLIFQK